jgi:hypothetical protein
VRNVTGLDIVHRQDECGGAEAEETERSRVGEPEVRGMVSKVVAAGESGGTNEQ